MPIVLLRTNILCELGELKRNEPIKGKRTEIPNVIKCKFNENNPRKRMDQHRQLFTGNETRFRIKSLNFT